MGQTISVPILSALLAIAVCAAAPAADEDPYLWLEEVENEKALEWARQRSAADTAVIEAVPEFSELHDKLLEIYNSRDRIPGPSIRGEWIYNFWRDADHVRGIWRRTSQAEFIKESPAWELVLDLDALAEAESENWVWKGATCLAPENRYCMVGLSRGGADAAVSREFDTIAKAFVEDGFMLPEAKSQVSWMDESTLWVGTDFGAGSLTTSGYPRLSKQWKRGTAIDVAETVFEGSIDDVAVGTTSDHTPEGRYDIVNLTPEFFRETNYLKLGERLVKLDVPDDAEMLGFFKDHLLVSLRTAWTVAGTTYPQGALLAIDLDSFLEGGRDFEMLFEPEARVSLGRVRSTVNYLLYTTLDNVRGRLYRLSPGEESWTKEEIELPGVGTISLGSTGDLDDSFFLTYTDFVTPSGLYLVREGKPEKVKSAPSWFDATGMTVVQYEATSLDGTKIPYFVFMPAGFEADGNNPTLLTAYGGFEVARVPRYSGRIGTSWVARGGVYVLANIRGGGEFGPSWHQAAMKEKHQNNFDDLNAVAEDLIARKITSPEHLGIMGGSQGGLLVAGSFVQRPELFNAVVCAVPLIDMKRYNKLLAGASWMAEYGNPDTDDWEYMKLWSPYQNLDPQQDYPKVFFWTNTRDDRVHPAHARKMVAKMTAMGKPVFYYENTEGGHGAGANLSQRAYTDALTYAYLWMMLR
ncbi:MAG: prolyl oligopeptidase family serine peptidase [Thermoanaerobaculia bacterium]